MRSKGHLVETSVACLIVESAALVMELYQGAGRVLARGSLVLVHFPPKRGPVTAYFDVILPNFASE